MLEASPNNALAPSTVTVEGNHWQVAKHWPGDKKKGKLIYEAKRLIGRDRSDRMLADDMELMPHFTLVPQDNSVDHVLQVLEDSRTTLPKLENLAGDVAYILRSTMAALSMEIGDEKEWRDAADIILGAENPAAVIHHIHRYPSGPVFMYGDVLVEPEEISALILRHCRHHIQTRQGVSADDCTITVPAHFTDIQRLATIDAAKIAGWTNVQLVNEPTAALVSYVYDENLEDGYYLLPDLGGGTFDVSVLLAETQDDGTKVFVVKATGGDNRLGGTTFTEVLMDIVRGRGANLEEEDLRAVCEQAKKRLSNSQETVLDADINPDTICRTEFENACRGILQRITGIVSNTLASSDVDEIRAVIMAGGAIDTLGLHQAIAEAVGETKIITPAQPSQLCARGASLIASGKAIITEVLSRGLGIELEDDAVHVYMHRHDPLPLAADHVFLPVALEGATIALSEGDEKLAKDNFCLGTFQLTGYASLDDEIKVTISVDEHRQIDVSAVSGANQSELRVQRSQRLTDEQIARMAEVCRQRYPGLPSSQQSEGGSAKRVATTVERETKRQKNENSSC